MVAGIAGTQEKILLCYGNANSDMKNFEANQLMLSCPDKNLSWSNATRRCSVLTSSLVKKFNFRI